MRNCNRNPHRRGRPRGGGRFVVYGGSLAGYGKSGGSYPLVASFRSAEGVTVGTDVRLAGVKVGTVTAMKLNNQSFFADTTLGIDGYVKIPDDTEARIASEGLARRQFRRASSRRLAERLHRGRRDRDDPGFGQPDRTAAEICRRRRQWRRRDAAGRRRTMNGMLAVLGLVALVAPALSPTVARAQAEPVTEAKGAVLRGLDKITGQTTDMEILDGHGEPYGRLEVSVEDCRFPTGNPAGNAYAHVTVIDREAPGSAPMFSGWMIAASPALNALDHPRYDVWVLHCITG